MEKTWGRSRGPILCETLQLTTDVSANALISWHVTGVWGQRRVSVLLEWKDRLLDGQSQPHSSSCDQSPASLTFRSFLVKGRDSHQDGIGVQCLHVVGAQPLSLSGRMSLPRREPPPVARWRLALPLSRSAPRVLWLWCYLARRESCREPSCIFNCQVPLSGFPWERCSSFPPSPAEETLPMQPFALGGLIVSLHLKVLCWLFREFSW